MYKLYTDKSIDFKANIRLQGTANIKNSFCRLVVESEDLSMVFNGDIKKGGKCEIPIKKMKGLLDEGSTGKMKFEVIADDTYFIPWEDKFSVESSKSVVVEIVENKPEKAKVMVEVESGVDKATTLMKEYFEKSKITKENLGKNQQRISRLMDKLEERYDLSRRDVRNVHKNSLAVIK